MNNQKKIFLVTADEDLVGLFNKSLNRYDVDLVIESNYNNAIQTLQQENFDLLITDYLLCADGNAEAFDSYSIEIETLENDIRLLTPMRESLIRLKNFIINKNKEKLFPLGNRISIEAELLGTHTIFLLNLIDPTLDEYDMREYLDDVSTYYCKYGRHVYYSPIGFKENIVDKFILEDVVDPMKIQKIY